MPLYAVFGHAPRLPDDGSVWIAPSADVIGEVHLAPGASIWFGAVVRADSSAIRIGARSNVQDGAVLHSDPGVPLTIGEECTIGHNAVLHGCTLGDGVLVGMGAIVLNGAVIGDECLVGAGALVTEGKIFPSRSMIVGAPARAVRTLDDAAAVRLRASAATYDSKRARYSTELSASSGAAAAAARS